MIPADIISFFRLLSRFNTVWILPGRGDGVIMVTTLVPTAGAPASQEGAIRVLSRLLEAVKQTYSGPAAKQYVAAISQYHRIQASPGFRAAAEYCLAALRSWGIDAHILSFPANTRTTYWTATMFQEWDASEATLDLILPGGKLRRLADYREDRISLIQRSMPFDGEAEVVVLARGDAEEEYEGLDVAGKVVLVQGDVAEVCRLAVEQRGAVGILFSRGAAITTSYRTLRWACRRRC